MWDETSMCVGRTIWYPVGWCINRATVGISVEGESRLFISDVVWRTTGSHMKHAIEAELETNLK